MAAMDTYSNLQKMWQGNRRKPRDWRRPPLGRQDLWSGGGDHYRVWLSSKRKPNVIVHAAVWGTIFSLLIIGYMFSADLIVSSHRLMRGY